MRPDSLPKATTCWRIKIRSRYLGRWYPTGPYFATELEAQCYAVYMCQKDFGHTPDEVVVFKTQNFLGATHHYPPTAPTKIKSRHRVIASLDVQL
jgi:hypothetical protein